MTGIQRLPLYAGLFLLTLGCDRGRESSKGEADKKQEPVITFVAASTKDAVEEIAAGLSGEKTTAVKINADDSSKLATQISEGAPAQLFLSANEKWADFVTEKGFTQDSKILLGNSLVIVVPKSNPAKVTQPTDLTNPEVTRLGVAGPTVPAGMYARQALKKLNLWDGLEESKKVVSGENVRVTLTYVERGEVDAGIVYATDALISNKVDAVYIFDSSLHDPIRYPLVLLKEGQKSSAARAFYDYLQTPQAKIVFKKYGFTILPGN